MSAGILAERTGEHAVHSAHESPAGLKEAVGMKELAGLKKPAGLKESALKKSRGRPPKIIEGGQAAIPTVSVIKKARGRLKSVNPLIGQERSMVIVALDITPTQHRLCNTSIRQNQ